MPENNPLPDTALAELDRLHKTAIPLTFANAAGHIFNAYPALRQRLLDAESRLAEAERERDQLRALADTARDGMRQLGEDLEASRAEVERLRKYNESLLRERNERIALVAGLRGALELLLKCSALGVAIPWGRAVAALTITPASAGARLKAEALRDAVEEVRHDVAAQESASSTRGALLCIADRLTAEAEKEAANGK